MARYVGIGAGLALLAGCILPTEHEEAPDYFMMDRQIEAGIIRQCRQERLLEQARATKDSTPVKWFDLVGGKCLNPHSQVHQEPAALGVVHIHRRTVSYIPDEQYDEIAYYCKEEPVWFYRYISPDRKKDVMLGPFVVMRLPEGGGAEPKGPHGH